MKSRRGARIKVGCKVPPFQVTLFRDFAEDRRMSMEAYANGLYTALQQYKDEGVQIHAYRPRLPAWLGAGPWRMRLARFAFYPWQALFHQNEINHILDHGYGHLLYPLGPKQTVVTVHDLIPLVRWRGEISATSAGPKPWLNCLAFNALPKAIHLVADSENTRRDLIRYLGCHPDRITVIYPGVETIFRPYSEEERDAARARLALDEKEIKRVLIIGSQFYKNPKGALKVMGRLCAQYKKPVQLIKIGEVTSDWTKAVAEAGLVKEVVNLGIIPRPSLPDLYNSVDVLLFPSLYEGFGWPPLEAMACGTPIVASNVASLPEVIDNAALMCSPLDTDGLAHAVRTIFDNPELCQSLITRGLAHVQQFTWEETARKMLALYEWIHTHQDKEITK